MPPLRGGPRLNDHALSDFLAGQSVGTRNRTSGKLNHGMEGLPTQQRAMEFWGDALPLLGLRGTERVKAAGGLRVDGHKNLVPAPNTGRLALVCYPGQGKYLAGTDLWYYDELPPDEDTLKDYLAGRTPWPDALSGRRFESLRAASQGYGWWPVIEWDFRQVRTGLEGPPIWVPAPGAPDEPSEEPTVPTWITKGPAIVDGTKKILVSCFYQLLEGEIVAWWIYIPVGY